MSARLAGWILLLAALAVVAVLVIGSVANAAVTPQTLIGTKWRNPSAVYLESHLTDKSYYDWGLGKAIGRWNATHRVRFILTKRAPAGSQVVRVYEVNLPNERFDGRTSWGGSGRYFDTVTIKLNRAKNPLDRNTCGPNVTAHEMGHSVGLDHSPDSQPDSIMYTDGPWLHCPQWLTPYDQSELAKIYPRRVR